MRRKVGYSLLLILVLAGVWYFFIKSHDYRISFEIANPKGVAYDHILKWNNNQPKAKKEVFTISKTPFTFVQQEFIPKQDSIFAIDWELYKKNDSVTKVIAYFTNKNSSLKQRAKILYSKTDFVKRSLSFTKELKKFMLYQIGTHKISQIDTTVISPKKFLYKEVGATIPNKALVMMAENGNIMSYIRQNNLTLDGFPFLEVKSWNKTNDSIKFNFCYPIKETHHSNGLITYRESDSFEAMQIIYNGNYKNSHVAWYAYEDYFEEEGVTKAVLPTEIYLNNPDQGGNELEWATRVLIPIKTDL